MRWKRKHKIQLENVARNSGKLTFKVDAALYVRQNQRVEVHRVVAVMWKDIVFLSPTPGMLCWQKCEHYFQFFVWKRLRSRNLVHRPSRDDLLSISTTLRYDTEQLKLWKATCLLRRTTKNENLGKIYLKLFMLALESLSMKQNLNGRFEN